LPDLVKEVIVIEPLAAYALFVNEENKAINIKGEIRRNDINFFFIAVNSSL